MRGRPTLWLPGTDHAGIATQLLVERSVIAEGKTRQELGWSGFLMFRVERPSNHDIPHKPMTPRVLWRQENVPNTLDPIH